MTQHLAIQSLRQTIYVSDRLVSCQVGDRFLPAQPTATKQIVFLLPDAKFVLGYCGLARFRNQWMDEYIIDSVLGKILADPILRVRPTYVRWMDEHMIESGEFAMDTSLGVRPTFIDHRPPRLSFDSVFLRVHQALARVDRAAPKTIDSQFMLVGYRVLKGKRHMPFGVVLDRAATRASAGHKLAALWSPRWTDDSRGFSTYALPATPRSVYEDVGSRLRTDPRERWTFARHAIEALKATIADIAATRDGIGPDYMVTILHHGAGVGYTTIDPYPEPLPDDEFTAHYPIGVTPWVVGPNGVLFPSLVTGRHTFNLAGMRLTVAGPVFSEPVRSFNRLWSWRPDFPR